MNQIYEYQRREAREHAKQIHQKFIRDAKPYIDKKVELANEGTFDATGRWVPLDGVQELLNHCDVQIEHLKTAAENRMKSIMSAYSRPIH